ncbi:LuxR C-terminal-related transcriptional regulator [Actinomycetospora endophytica]|uniref:LuxR C-terminal-related transcriptional regulator n=1 Tax=Actinomycetospora endophytica TaxID=2291215 RepID=A0ABS8PDD4_9PSEU|nr:LuxR C-terminal-related transcriptional regulator [Actinomycetospora endophytica]MCD2195416.1 LuxR C-terminal-related transcriptional regulator [Actinomycetospora endophytica]
MAPRVPDGLVRRPRLRSLLDASTRRAAITLLRAEPGQGRTVMLADWARTATTAWLSLDATIRRPDRFWAVVAAAVAHSVPRLAADLSLPSGRRVEPITAGGVIAVLDRLPHEVRLVLDDLHELTDPAVLDELRTLIRYRPSRLRLVLSSRTEPPLPLARLRVQGDLVDIDGDALTFTREETAAFVAGAGLPVRPEEVDRLHHLTAGWATALRLATDTAAGGPIGLEDVLAMLAGADGPGAGRLARGLLERLPEGDRSFLAAVSIADPVPTDLAVELSGRDDAPSVLARLRVLGLVTDGPEPGRHHIQPLVRRHLRADMARRHPTRAAALHGRAARWFATAGDPVRALEHARQTDDRDLVADLVRGWAIPLVLTGHHGDLRAGLRRLGTAAVARDRRLRAAGELLAAAGTADGGGMGDPDGEMAGLRALRDRIRAIRPGDDAAVAGLEPVPEVRAAAVEAMVAACEGARVLLLRGDPAAARGPLQDALATARAWGWSSLTMRCAALLAAADLVDSDTAGMERHAALAVDAAAEGDRRSAAAVSARVVLAYAALLRARPDDARHHAAEGLTAAGETAHPAARLLLHTVHGAAEADGGRPVEGLEEARQARAAFSDRPLARREAILVATLEHQMAVAAGRPEQARAVRRWITGRVGTTGDVLLMAALAEPSTGSSLRPLVDGSVLTLLAESEIEARLRQIGAGQVVADPAGARASLRGALDRAAPLGLVRPFAHSPGPVRRLMAHQVGTFGDTDGFVRRALAAGPSGRRAGPVDALSERETAVLRLLPSLATMSEIAGELEVSVNTVKTQVGAIYAKLGVGDRRGAVVAAYDAGLLPTPDHVDPWWEPTGVG